MLSIQPLSSAQGAADYYAAAFNYYAGDAAAMLWLGKGSEHLGLQGIVKKEDMLALLEGQLPNGVRLQNLKGEHRPGFDMTFSAPKSVSLLVGLGVAPELMDFHDKAVKYAITEIEKEFAETRITRDGEMTFEKTGNLVVAAFRQPTSRANEPALHTHAVAMNMTFLNGKARSLASDPSRTHGVIEQIQNNAHYCGLIYRQHLANQLKEAKFPLQLTGDGLFEIAGIPREVLRGFSSRRVDIERYMDEEGWDGAKSAAAATLLTRHGKVETDSAVLEVDWQKRAKDLGFDAQEFVQNYRKSFETHSWFSGMKDKILSLVSINKKTPSKDTAQACVQVAIETLSQRDSVFSERTLLAQSMKHSLVCPQIIDKKKLADAIQKEKSLQNLYVAKCPDTQQVLLTTPWLLTLETETIARIEHNKGLMPSISSKGAVEAFQKERASLLPHPLTNSQKESMISLLTSKDRFSAIQGFAGVAKTSMLAEAKILIEQKGYSLRGLTVASSASNELQIKAGIRSDVFPIVHQELKNAPTGSLYKTVFIADESSMLSSSQGHELLKQVERTGARLVLVGDKAQLPSVNTGRIFGLMQEYGIETTVMNEIVRQKNQNIKKAVVLATHGNVKEALEKLDIQILGSHEERIKWIATQWLSLTPQRREETLLFAPTHANREDITGFIRQGLKEEGTLKGDAHIQTVLKTKNLEPVQQRFVAYYQKGDVVRFNQSISRNSIKQGHYYRVGQVTSIHLRDNVLPLINDKGQSLKLPLKNLPQYKTHSAAFERVIELYEPKPLELLIGDKVMWTRNFKDSNIRNGQCAVLSEIDDKSFHFTTSEGNLLVFDKTHAALKHLDYSYVFTNYKVQGKDAPYGIGLMESYHRFSATMKNFYVQVSRAIHGMTLVTDNKEDLIKAIRKNSDEKSASLDIISAEQLRQHEKRFIDKSQISLQPVIEKQLHLELEKSSRQSASDSIGELNFKKGINSQFKEKIKEIFKELEL